MKFFILFLLIIWGCSNTKPETPKEDLIGEVISVCQDSVLTQEVDGQYYRKIIVKFKVTNYSKLIYYTYSYGNQINADKVQYFINNDSASYVMNYFDHEKDSILPNSSQVFINITTPFKLAKWIKKSFYFYANVKDSGQKSKEVVISFNPNKMVNCK